jgi:hypothetical protein
MLCQSSACCTVDDTANVVYHNEDVFCSISCPQSHHTAGKVKIPKTAEDGYQRCPHLQLFNKPLPFFEPDEVLQRDAPVLVLPAPGCGTRRPSCSGTTASHAHREEQSNATDSAASLGGCTLIANHLNQTVKPSGATPRSSKHLCLLPLPLP